MYCLSLDQCFTSSSFLICLHCHHNKSSSLTELNYFCVSRYMHTMACSICSTTKQISPILWRPSFCRTNIAAQDWTIFSVLISSASNSFHYFCYGSMQLLKLAACRLSHCTQNICRIMYHAIDRISNKRQMVENTYASVSAIFTSICKKIQCNNKNIF